jgi:hypothetical protein
MNLRIEPFGHCVRDAVHETVEDVLEMTTDDAGNVDHRLEAGANGPRLPAIEEGARRRDGLVVPDGGGTLPSSPTPVRI